VVAGTAESRGERIMARNNELGAAKTAKKADCHLLCDFPNYGKSAKILYGRQWTDVYII